MLNLASAKSKKEEEMLREVDAFLDYIRDKRKHVESQDIRNSVTEIGQQILQHSKFR